jgi:hypothetical protein
MLRSKQYVDRSDEPLRHPKIKLKVEFFIAL